MPEAALASLIDEVGQPIIVEFLFVDQPNFDARRKEFTGPLSYAAPVEDRALVMILSSDDEPVKAGRLPAGSLRLRFKAHWNRTEQWPETTSQQDTYVVADEVDVVGSEEALLWVLVEKLFGVRAFLENARITYEGEAYIVTEVMVRRHGSETVWLEAFAEVRNRG